MGKQAAILSILLFLGLPFLTQLELFPFQKLTMFSSNIPMRRVKRTIIVYQNKEYYHPATSFMLDKKADCGLARSILTKFYKVDAVSGPVQVLHQSVLQGDTISRTLSTTQVQCP